MTANPHNEKSSRPNYFELLGLDPSRPFDEQAYLTQLAENVKKWKQKLNNGTTEDQREAQRRLGFESDIRTVMRDPVQRDKEAAGCIKLWASNREKRIAAYRTALSVVALSSEISEEAVAKLLEYRDVVPESAIRSDIEGIRQSKPSVPEPAILGAARRQEIARKLNFIQESTLYSFVKSEDKKNSDGNPNLHRSGPHSDWRDAAHRVYVKLKNNMNKSADPELETKYDLAGIAETCFSSDENRQQYDNTLEYLKIEALLNQYLTFCASARRINSQQVAAYLNRAGELSCDPKLAYGFLCYRAQKDQREQKKWEIAPFPTQPTASPPPQPAPPPTQRCGNPTCHAVNDATRVTCTKCHEPLRITCPKCGKEMPTDDACANCHFPIHNIFKVKKLLGEARASLATGELRQAKVKVVEASSLWHPRQSDELSRELSKLEAAITQGQAELDEQERKRKAQEKAAREDLARRTEEALRQKEQREALQRTLTELDRLIGERMYCAAQPLAHALPASAPERARYLTTIDDAITRVRSRLEQAQQSSDPEQQEAMCRQALDICADFTGARDYLEELIRRQPPVPPPGLTVMVQERAAHLAWEPSRTAGVSYLVVRKTGSPPLSARDGTRVYAGTALACDDRIDPGVFTYYVVYAERNGVLSRSAATSPGAVLYAAEVSDLACRPSDGVIELTWRTPPNAERVIIARKAGSAPRTRHDTEAQEIAPTGANTLVDRDVRNGTEYFYLLYCRYVDGQGHHYYSTAEAAHATPNTPPASIPRVAVAGHTSLLYAGQHVVTFEAPAPARGDLVVLRCDQPPRLPTPLSADHLARFGKVCQPTTGDALEQAGRYWYIPIIVDQGMAYPGAPECYEWAAPAS